MNMHEKFAQAEAAALNAPQSARFSWLGSLSTWLAMRIRAYAAYHAAAAAYADLARLSDAELARRGLSRHTLAHDLNDMERDQASGREPSQ